MVTSMQCLLSAESFQSSMLSGEPSLSPCSLPQLEKFSNSLTTRRKQLLKSLIQRKLPDLSKLHSAISSPKRNTKRQNMSFNPTHTTSQTITCTQDKSLSSSRQRCNSKLTNWERKDSWTRNLCHLMRTLTISKSSRNRSLIWTISLTSWSLC